LSAIIQILKANNAKATFFTTGKSAIANSTLIKQAFDNGNQIANHTYDHASLITISYDKVQEELNEADAAIVNVTGKSSKPYFRTPYYDYNSSVLQAAGDAGYTKAIMCDVNSVDWSGISASQITQTVLNNVGPGSIVGMHAGSGADNTPAALSTIISSLKAKGYSFVTVSELLGYASSSTTTSSSSSSYPGILKYGSSGTAVKQLQQALVNKGYKISMDGSFGPATRSAVMSYQSSQGLTVDGIVGPSTWSKLFSGTSTITVTNSVTTTSSSYSGVLKYGSSGAAVKQLQQALVNKGYKISVDGSFGPATRSAVMSFQSSQGIAADGIVGSVTWGRLF
jgi:peptidoglycan-N-acetylglucosamine deacetylase